MSEKMSLNTQMGPTSPDLGGMRLQQKLEADRAAQIAASETLTARADVEAPLVYVKRLMEQYPAKTLEEVMQKIQEEMAIQQEVKQKMAESRERKKQQAIIEDKLRKKLLREAISLGDYEQQGSVDEILGRVDKIQGFQEIKPPADLHERVYGQVMAARGQREGFAQGLNQEREIEARQTDLETDPRATNQEIFLGSERPSGVSISEEVASKGAQRREEAGSIGELTLADLMRQDQENKQPPSSSIDQAS